MTRGANSGGSPGAAPTAATATTRATTGTGTTGTTSSPVRARPTTGPGTDRRVRGRPGRVTTEDRGRGSRGARRGEGRVLPRPDPPTVGVVPEDGRASETCGSLTTRTLLSPSLSTTSLRQGFTVHTDRVPLPPLRVRRTFHVPVVTEGGVGLSVSPRFWVFGTGDGIRVGR